MVRSSFSASSFEVYPERYAHTWEGDYAKGRRERPLSANNPGLRYAPLLDADSSQDFAARKYYSLCNGLFVTDGSNNTRTAREPQRGQRSLISRHASGKSKPATSISSSCPVRASPPLKASRLGRTSF